MKKKKRHPKIKYRVKNRTKVEQNLKEQKVLYETAQRMLIREVIRFIDDGDYVNLKQFCLTYI